jgi:hypothetical protein
MLQGKKYFSVYLTIMIPTVNKYTTVTDRFDINDGHDKQNRINEIVRMNMSSKKFF